MTQPPQEPEPLPAGRRRARVLGFALIGITAVLAPSLLIRAGPVDSAALFVGVPLLIAVSIVLMPTPKNLHGLTFRVVTFVVLITSAYLHEGAACVLMASPLVYGVAHFFVELVEMKRRDQEAARRGYALIAVPLLLALSLEGVIPGLRAVPAQTVSQERLVAMSPSEVEQRLAVGPQFNAVRRPGLLRVTGYPTPTAATGSGLAVGSRWTFTMAGDPIETEVVERAAGRLAFKVVRDESKTQRWLTWQGGTVNWHADGAGTAVRIEVTFVRRLDPSWYFGPMESAMVGAGLDHFTDALGLANGR